MEANIQRNQIRCILVQGKVMAIPTLRQVLHITIDCGRQNN